MDCHSETTTVDLCSEPDCVNSTVMLETRAAGLKTHLPSHRMFKIHRIIFARDIGKIEGTAKDTLNSARGTLSGLKEGEPMPECIHCKTRISLPCWCCTDCTGE